MARVKLLRALVEDKKYSHTLRMSLNFENVRNRRRNKISSMNGLSQEEKNAFIKRINNTFNTNTMNKAVKNAEIQAAVKTQVQTFVKNEVVRRSRRPAKEVAHVIVLAVSHFALLMATALGETNKLMGVVPVYAPSPKTWLNTVRNYVGAVSGGQRHQILIQRGRLLFEPAVGGYSRFSKVIMIEAFVVLISIAVFQKSSNEQKDRAKEVLHHIIVILKEYAPAALDLLKDIVVAAMKGVRPDLSIARGAFELFMNMAKTRFGMKNMGIRTTINDMRRIQGDPTLYSPMRVGEKRMRQGNAIISETPGGSREVRTKGQVHRENKTTGVTSVRRSSGRKNKTPPPTLPAP